MWPTSMPKMSTTRLGGLHSPHLITLSNSLGLNVFRDNSILKAKLQAAVNKTATYDSA
jgi:hypothetical protein